MFALFGCNGNNNNTSETSNVKLSNIDAQQFKTAIENNDAITLIDVRTEDEYNAGHIDGALNININGSSFADEIAKLDKNKPVYVYCLSGGRSSNAANYMSQQGFKEIYNMQGGIMAWNNAKFETVQGPADKIPSKNLISADAFNKIINTQPLVLVDFYAPWCAPCKVLSPIVEEVEKEMGVFKLQKVNYDDIDDAVKNSAQITTVPLLVLYKNGKEVWKNKGVIKKEALIEAINQHK